MARRVLAGQDYDAGPGALHIWLRLPAPWRADEFARRAREAGVLIASNAPFLAGQAAAPALPAGEQAVRVCLGGPTSRERLAWALDRLADVLGEGAAPPRLPEMASIL